MVYGFTRQYGGQVTIDSCRGAGTVVRPGLPVLFTSGHVEEAMARRAGPGDAVHLLPKPYGRQGLAKKLRAVLDNARMGAGPEPEPKGAS